MSRFFTLMGVKHPFDKSHRFVTSWLFPAPLLASIRLFFALYAFTAIFVRWGLRPAAIGGSFSYFTQLTYFGLAFYFLFAGFHGLYYSMRGVTLLERWGRILQMLH